jgi:protein-disulfide isomerase
MAINPSKKTRTIIAAILVVALAGIILPLALAEKNRHTAAPEETNTANTPGENPLLTEFGDFQCPHCARFALQILPALERDLIEPGTVRFEYRHYPFLGPESMEAAEASECAREQGGFDEYHLELYRLTSQGTHYTTEHLLEIAQEQGLETANFQQCLQSGRKRPRVLEDQEYGRNLGVRGTPTLLMDGRKINWTSYPDLREQIRKMAQGP